MIPCSTCLTFVHACARACAVWLLQAAGRRVSYGSLRLEQNESMRQRTSRYTPCVERHGCCRDGGHAAHVFETVETLLYA